MKQKTLSLLFLFALAGSLTSCNLPTLSGNPEESPTITPTHTLVAPESPTPSQTVMAMTLSWIERRYDDEAESPKYEIQAVWPNLEGEAAQVDPFNARINERVDSAISDFLAALADGVDMGEGQGEPPTSTLMIDYDLTNEREGVFSVLLSETTYIAIAAHPGTTSFALNYDVGSGVFLQLADLFLAGSDYMTVILDRVDATLAGRGFDYQPGQAAEVMADRENWNLLPEGLRINFDAYEVGPYAAGPQYVTIPWADLAEVLDPNGAAGIYIME
ncbi:RsiV family protein [bacterium]|nr:RsiV family protein [bacterium]